MGLIGIIKNVLRRTPRLSDRDRVRNILVREVAYSSALAGFICHGVNHGSHARITIEIDGTACEIGILAAADEPLMVYLAQWACVQKLKKHIRLEEFNRESGGRQDIGPSGGPTNMTPGAKLADPPNNDITAT